MALCAGLCTGTGAAAAEPPGPQPSTAITPERAMEEGLCTSNGGGFAPCPEAISFIEQGERQITSALDRNDFGKLERLYAKWASGEPRFPDGRWKLAWFDTSLAGAFAIRAWQPSLQVLQQWQKAHPDSMAARLAEATYWRAYAWHARGTGYARTVSPEAWALFRERMAKARRILEDLPPDCPPRYSLLIDTLVETSGPEADMKRYYEEGIARFPQYHSIYFAMARHHEPRWGGTAIDYERFASQVAAATRGFEGQGMYARLYWIVDFDGGLPFANRPGRAPEWPKLRAAFEDLMRTYPNSMHNMGQYLNVACRSPDTTLYRKLRDRIPEDYVPYVNLNESIEVCDKRHGYVAGRR